jgi:hypothetical protein
MQQSGPFFPSNVSVASGPRDSTALSLFTATRAPSRSSASTVNFHIICDIVFTYASTN